MGSQHWSLVTYGWDSKSDRPFTFTFLFVWLVFDPCYLAESVYQLLVCVESLGLKSSDSLPLPLKLDTFSFFLV